MKPLSNREIRARVDTSHITDPRFQAYVQQRRDLEMNAVLGFLDGTYKPLGEWSSRTYRCVILDDPKHSFLCFKLGDLRPVPQGRWMGQPEKHWKISKRKWEQMSLQERAVRECREQVARWVWREWSGGFIRFYMPRRCEKALLDYWATHPLPEVPTSGPPRLIRFKIPTFRDLFPGGLPRLIPQRPAKKGLPRLK